MKGRRFRLSRRSVEAPAQVVITYQSELDALSRYILDYPQIETGGQLFGFWTAGGVPVVLFALGPGARANHQVTFFNQEIAYLEHVGERLIARLGLQHIGEWHSHHQLGLSVPSGHDVTTMVRSIRRRNLGRFLLAIGNCRAGRSTINAYPFTQSAGAAYATAAWEVKPGLSPFRAAIEGDVALAAMIAPPRTPLANHGNLRLVAPLPTLAPPTYAKHYWLSEKANNRVLQAIIAGLSALGEPCAARLDAAGLVWLVQRRREGLLELCLGEDFPAQPPRVWLAGRALSATWPRTGELAKGVVAYCQAALNGVTDDERTLQN